MKTYPKSDQQVTPTKTKETVNRIPNPARHSIHVGMAFDHGYLSPFIVLLTSIFENNGNNKFHVHAIATGLSVAEKNNLRTLVRKHRCEISFYEIKDKRSAGFYLPANSHMSISAYYRLFFAGLVPKSVKKLLYLDTDILVHNNLAELYNTDMGKKPVAAVPELNNKNSVRPELGLYRAGEYFNSGVLLINMRNGKSNRSVRGRLNLSLPIQRN